MPDRLVIRDVGEIESRDHIPGRLVEERRYHAGRIRSVRIAAAGRS
jgi:hypothetical protein